MYAPGADIIAQVMAHAVIEAPREACGIIADGQFFPMPNLALELDSFVIDRAAYLELARSRRIEAIAHSHVFSPPVASDADRSSCEATGVPWLIVSYPDAQWTVIEPSGFVAPLVGRQWAWGVHDCYGLVRDAVRAYCGIQIPDFPRVFEFWKQGLNPIVEQFHLTGFVEMPQGTVPRQCDVLGFAVHSGDIVNHLGVFLEPDQLLHQLHQRPSVREVYGGTWQKLMRLHLRYGGFVGADEHG